MTASSDVPMTSDPFKTPSLLQAFKGVRVLVTGASGFLGRHTCRRLFELGAEVHAVSRSAKRQAIDCHSWHPLDCTDFAKTHQTIREISPEIILHLAGVADGRRDRDLIVPTFHGNVSSTVHVLAASADVSCRRIVLAGSLEEPLLEELAQSLPTSPYATSKTVSTLYADLFRRLYKTPVTVARIFMTFGPGQPTHKVLPAIISSLLRGKAPEIDSGDRLVDWIYVDDTVSGLLALASMTEDDDLAEGIQANTFDIGTGTLHTIREVVELIAGLLDSRILPIFAPSPRRENERVAVANLERISTATGWRPRMNLQQGLIKTIDHQRETTKFS